MNWNNILENFLGNALSDIFVVAIVTVVITKYFENLKDRDDVVSGLVQVSSEIDFNVHLLEQLLKEGITAFEKEYHRGAIDEVDPGDAIFEAAAKFMSISTERLLVDGYKSSFKGFSKMENHILFEKIVNLYLVEYYHQIQTSFRMGQLNWVLLDSIKNRIQAVIDNSNIVKKRIKKEIKKLKRQSILKKTLSDLSAIVRSFFT